MQEAVTIPVEYVQLIGEQLRSVGVSVDTWLEQAGTSVAELEDAERLLEYPRFRRLVLGALELAGEPAMGLLVGRRLVASTHGVVGAAAVNSKTVRQALEMMERFAHLRSTLIAISHEIDAREGRVIFTEAFPLGDVQRPLLEAIVLSIKTVLDEITLGTCQIHEVAFPFPAPEYAALARDMFGCNVRYRQKWAGFTAPADVLGLPLKLADPAAFEEAALVCQRELEHIAAHQTTSARVRRLLLENQSGFPSLQVTARVFHMTPRTLHRRLVEEGTSFREQLESVRRTLAVEHVKSGRFSMEEIAYRLGYTDLANFRRAFKRWEGLPPSEYRERRRAQG